MDFTRQTLTYLESLKTTIDHLNRDEINTFLSLILEAYEHSKTIFLFGNGGSAVTASHFASDLNKGVGYGLAKKVRAIALTDNIPAIMAYANDVGYEYIFIEQLKSFLEPGDLVIGISGSGNSPNVLRAIEYAQSCGNPTIGITGYDGGKLKALADHSVNARIDDMQISEDIHMILTHLTMRVLCQTLMK
jgi:D-sedoheptulose 7-phosphate isomerase